MAYHFLNGDILVCTTLKHITLMRLLAFNGDILVCLLAFNRDCLLLDLCSFNVNFLSVDRLLYNRFSSSSNRNRIVFFVLMRSCG